MTDLAPLKSALRLIGEDPERIEYLWQSCFRRRFYRGGVSTGAASLSTRAGTGSGAGTSPPSFLPPK